MGDFLSNFKPEGLKNRALTLANYSLYRSNDNALELTSLSHQDFKVIYHPVFPGRSLRIKKSKFCDGGRLVNQFWRIVHVGPGGSSTMGLFLELGPSLKQLCEFGLIRPTQGHA